MMRPFITMQGQAKDALDFYQAVFPSFEMISLQHHSEPHENLIMLTDSGSALLPSLEPFFEWAMEESPDVSNNLD